MDYSMTSKYSEGHRIGPFREWSREDDLYDDLLFLQSSGEENRWFLRDPKTFHLQSNEPSREDLFRIIDRCTIAFVAHNMTLENFQHYLHKRKEIAYLDEDFIEDLYDQRQIHRFYDDAGLCMDDIRKSSIDKGNRSTLGRSDFKLSPERDTKVKELTYKLEKKQQQCLESQYTISQLPIKQKQLYDSDSKIIFYKHDVEMKIWNLKREIKDLEHKLRLKDIQISGFSNQANLRRNFYAESESTRGNRNNSVEMKLKISEYERKIEIFERSNKEKEVQLSALEDQYNACLTKQQKMKADFEHSVSSLQRDIALRDNKMKYLEDELKQYKAISSGNNFDHFEHIERSSTEIKGKRKLSDQEIIENRQDKEHDKTLSVLRSECQDKSQKISDLQRQLKEALQKLNNTKEELRVNETSHKDEVSNFNADYSRLETKSKSQQRSFLTHERTCIELTEENKSLHKMIGDHEKQVRRQREQHQEALKQMQERENELVNRIDMQKKEIKRLENELHMSKTTLSHLEKSMQSKTLEKNTNEAKADADQRKKIAELTKQLQEALTKLNDTETELAETKSRLSKVMGNKLTDNNPNITDLSDRNRPTKLAEKYAELYDNQWTDAFDVLEKSYHKEEYVIETLLHILLDVFTFCWKKAKTQMKNLGQELKFAGREDKGDVTVDVRKLLKECRKAVGFTENLPKMYQSYLEQSTNDRTKTALKVRAFTAECLEMCWYMVIQDPPVAFAPILSKGSSFDTDFYKPYTISGAKVDFVVWPPLLLQEGGQILAKGVAQGCGKKTAS